jgi:hypothetical protein
MRWANRRFTAGRRSSPGLAGRADTAGSVARVGAAISYLAENWRSRLLVTSVVTRSTRRPMECDLSIQ